MREPGEGNDDEDGDDLWRRLGGPRFVVAPMVDASELAWRLLCRKHGAQLCYSPMYHSVIFIKDSRYRREALASCPEDRPLIIQEGQEVRFQVKTYTIPSLMIQFCGNNPEVMLQAARLAESHCDAIDINLGCPQAIAKRGNYGAFLQDDWELLASIVETLSKNLRVPVTCKIRIFESVEKTVQYAQMLEKAGCKMLAVHGRIREQKGPLTGLASWLHIKAIRASVKIPVVANGNIQCLADVQRCFDETDCDGVMTAEGNLHNPFLFEGVNPVSWEPALEYLSIVKHFPCPLSYVRGHLFKIFHKVINLDENFDLRDEIAKGNSVHDFEKTCNLLKSKYLPYHEGERVWMQENTNFDLTLPPWLCQPYVRIPPEEHLIKLEASRLKSEKENLEITGKRTLDQSSPELGLSKKKLKRFKRLGAKALLPSPHSRRDVAICSTCPNPMGLKCDSSLCKTCCRNKCYKEEADCVGHGILIKTRRERARKLAKNSKNTLET